MLEALEGRETPSTGSIRYFPATAVATSPTSGEVRWEFQPDVVSYDVLLAAADAAFFASVGTTTGDHLPLSGLRPGTTYDGFVAGKSASDEYFYRSTTVYIDTPPGAAPPVVAPPTITAFSAQAIGEGEIAFHFAADGALALTLEQQKADGSWSSVADFFGLATGHTLGEAPDGATLVYRLSARNEAGTTVSAPLFVTTPAKAALDLRGVSLAVAVGADGTSVRIFDRATGTERGSLTPFGTGPLGSIAFVDVNGDGVTDVVAGTGPGVPSQVRAFDGRDAFELWTVNPFEADFLGGVEVAGGDLDGDGVAEVAVAAGDTGSPRVRLFDGGTHASKADFFALDRNARGGAHLAIGDFDGDGKNELLVGAGRGMAPEIRLLRWDGSAVVELARSQVFENAFTGGVRVAAFDFDGDGVDDALATPGAGGGPRRKVMNAFYPNVIKLDDFAGDAESRDGLAAIALGSEPAPLIDSLGLPGTEGARLLAASRPSK